MMQIELEWPNIFFGTVTDVRHGVKRAVRQLFQKMDWSLVPEFTTDLVPDVGAEDLLLGPGYPYIRPSQPLWRLYLLSEALLAQIVDGKSPSSDYYALVLSGVKQLWVAVSLVGGIDGPPLKTPLDRTARLDFEVALLNSFLYWMPEITLLGPRLIDFSSHCRRLLERDPIAPNDGEELPAKTEEDVIEENMKSAPAWQYRILHLACGLGWQVDNKVVYGTYKGDALQNMLDDRVIEIADGRYRLTEDFVRAVPKRGT